MEKHLYRICCGCRRPWNVSILEPGDKIYYCPQCEARRKGPIRSQPTKASADEAKTHGGVYLSVTYPLPRDKEEIV